MKSATSLIAAGIILLMLPAIMLAIDQFRLTDQADPFLVPSGANSTAVTLSQELFNDDTSNVSSIASNITTDAPIASSYVSATQALTITGLQTGSDHYLTVTYSIDNLGDYFGAAAGSRVLPVLLILGILCIVGGAGYQAFRRGE